MTRDPPPHANRHRTAAELLKRPVPAKDPLLLEARKRPGWEDAPRWWSTWTCYTNLMVRIEGRCLICDQAVTSATFDRYHEHMPQLLRVRFYEALAVHGKAHREELVGTTTPPPAEPPRTDCYNCSHWERHVDWVPYGDGSTPMYTGVCHREDELPGDHDEEHCQLFERLEEPEPPEDPPFPEDD